MKKLFLLIAAGFVAGGASAQVATNNSIVKLGAGVAQKTRTTVVDKATEDVFKKINAQKEARRIADIQGSANKTTASGSRVYNWSDYMKLVNVMNQSLPYMWFKGEGKGIYQGTTGLELDTISLGSYAMAVAPWSVQYNDEGVPDYVGKIALSQTTPYTLDSVATYGAYGRNRAKEGIVDTLIFGVAWSTRTWRAWGETATNAGLPSPQDTLRCAGVSFNPNTCTVDTFNGQMIKIIKLPLYPADTANSRFVVSVGQAIPAGNIISCGITFKSGDASYVPYADTVFAGSATPDRPFKYGMLRPAMYEATVGQYAQYIAGSVNTGLTRHYPMADTVIFYEEYVPTYFYSAAEYNLEFSDIDFVISATNAPYLVGVNKIASNITGANAYPNPANGEVKVKFMLTNTFNTTVSIMNTVGQVISTQNMGNVSAGEATFSTANLTNGVYFYTVEANGQRTTNRFVVAH